MERVAAESDLAAEDEDLVLRALQRMRLLRRGEPADIVPLTGGVSSDIWRVRTPRDTLAIKRARPQLKVSSEWRAPVERNAYEVKWFRVAGAICSGCVPEILGEDREAGLFAMSYLDPARFPIWKSELRDARVDLAFAVAVGERLARIHSLTAGRGEIAAAFATDATFHAIRLEAYLEATAAAHPELAARLLALSRATLATKRALVHGDVSPKNILVGTNGPVFLDAECAWYGDPAFDLAFCLKHFLLKCLWTPSAAAAFLDAFSAMAQAYFAGADWEAHGDLEARVAALLPALFLARADGRSPVEYLDESGRERVRRVAVPLVREPTSNLATIRSRWAAEVGVTCAA